MARVLVAVILILFAGAPICAQSVVATGVAEDATSANSQPKLARDSRGTVYLTFVKPAGGFAQIFVASSDDDGHSWRLEQLTAGRFDSRYPTLAVGPDNHVHVAWTQYDGGTGKVHYAWFDGRRWTTPLRISPGQAYAGVPAIAVDGEGTVHVVWYGIREQAPQVRTRHGSIYEILYSGAPGGRWTPPELISPGIPDSINPTLAVDDRGRLHSAWYQFDLKAYQVQHTQRDRTWTPPEQLSAGSDDAFSVAMAVGRVGSVYLVWERRQSSGSQIYFAERQQRWSQQQPVSPAGTSAFNPSVVVDNRARVYVAWEGNGQIHLRRRDRRWLGTERLATQGKNSQPILASVGGIVDLMWTQQVGGEHQLRFATIAGSLTAPPRSPSRSLWGPIILAVIIVMALWQWRRIRGVGVAR